MAHFHIVNGESTLALLRETGIPGETLVWPDMLMEGPLPTREDGGLDWPARAAFLSVRYGIPRGPALARMRAFEKALVTVAGEDAEITLWFEEDFFCQIHLVYLLVALSRAGRKARLSVICPAKPLGTLKPKALVRLFAARRAPDRDRVALARKVWSLLSYRAAQSGGRSARGRAASRSGSPSATVAAAWQSETRLAALLKDTPAFASWPRLRRGLKAHLDRRPASAGPFRGLGSVEAALVEAVRASGRRAAPFAEVFRKVVSLPRVRPLGLGDLQVARVARDLAGREEAPIRLLGARKKAKASYDLKTWRLAAG